MKNLKKIVAGVFAAALVFGMSVSTFAASPSASDVKAGDVVWAFHQKDDKTVEVIKDTTVENGAVNVTFNSLSPVAPVRVTSASNGSDSVVLGAHVN